jgi:Tfp pilus assembly protein PilF
VTGVAGQVAEPYLESVVRPDVLFAAYVAGFNLIEAFYLALPHLSWQSIVVGDPLCSPFPRTGVPAADLAPEINAETTLPAFFSERRMRQVAAENTGIPTSAITAWVRSNAMLARGNRPDGIKALEETVALAPKAVGARLVLAVLYESDNRPDPAMEQYKQILELDPNNVITLNNFAFSLAVRRGQPKEALSYAQRALALAPSSGSILDTLAWIEHLTGDDVSAARKLAEAIRLTPGDADIRLHAAIVYAQNGARTSAELELKEALRLNPALEKSEDVKALRAKLAALSQK